MCGRFTLRTPASVLIEHFDLDVRGDRQLPLFEARYNIAPTQEVLTVRSGNEMRGRHASMMRWGLIPPWTASDKLNAGPPLINARSETLADKPTFRTAYRRRRCLIPTDGFYEWQKSATTKRGKKQAYYIHKPDHGPFAFAGLWEKWYAQARNDKVLATETASVELPPETEKTRGVKGLAIESCTIVTTSANETLKELHDRMPVVIAPCDYETWLDPTLDNVAALQRLLSPCGEEELIAEPVSAHVNKVSNDDPRCIAIERSLF